MSSGEIVKRTDMSVSEDGTCLERFIKCSKNIAKNYKGHLQLSILIGGLLSVGCYALIYMYHQNQLEELESNLFKSQSEQGTKAKLIPETNNISSRIEMPTQCIQSAIVNSLGVGEFVLAMALAAIEGQTEDAKIAKSDKIAADAETPKGADSAKTSEKDKIAEHNSKTNHISNPSNNIDMEILRILKKPMINLDEIKPEIPEVEIEPFEMPEIPEVEIEPFEMPEIPKVEIKTWEFSRVRFGRLGRSAEAAAEAA